MVIFNINSTLLNQYLCYCIIRRALSEIVQLNIVRLKNIYLPLYLRIYIICIYF